METGCTSSVVSQKYLNRMSVRFVRGMLSSNALIIGFRLYVVYDIDHFIVGFNYDD